MSTSPWGGGREGELGKMREWSVGRLEKLCEWSGVAMVGKVCEWSQLAQWEW